ncbi:hypothetical protein [Leptolyngbya sp. FACHB-17]|nr:hypothetical protein [Leptolyngbya sp. FACHB-17]
MTPNLWTHRDSNVDITSGSEIAQIEIDAPSMPFRGKSAKLL